MITPEQKQRIRDGIKHAQELGWVIKPRTGVIAFPVCCALSACLVDKHLANPAKFVDYIDAAEDIGLSATDRADFVIGFDGYIHYTGRPLNDAETFGLALRKELGY